MGMLRSETVMGSPALKNKKGENKRAMAHGEIQRITVDRRGWPKYRRQGPSCISPIAPRPLETIFPGSQRGQLQNGEEYHERISDIEVQFTNQVVDAG
jgi:hypothetical protein